MGLNICVSKTHVSDQQLDISGVTRSLFQPAMEATDAESEADDDKHNFRLQQLGNGYLELARVAHRPIMLCITTIAARLNIVWLLVLSMALCGRCSSPLSWAGESHQRPLFVFQK